jgi:hypothetical protein
VSHYTLIKVNSRRQAQAFLRLPKLLHKSNPDYVLPRCCDVENAFCHEKSKLLQEGGEAVRFMLEDENGNLVGRIAAFVNPPATCLDGQPTGFIDFFDSVSNQEVTSKLLNACRQWLEVRGVRDT